MDLYLELMSFVDIVLLCGNGEMYDIISLMRVFCFSVSSARFSAKVGLITMYCQFFGGNSCMLPLKEFSINPGIK